LKHLKYERVNKALRDGFAKKVSEKRNILGLLSKLFYN